MRHRRMVTRGALVLVLVLVATGLAGDPGVAYGATQGGPSQPTPAHASYIVALAGEAQGRHWVGTQHVTFQNVSSLTLDTIWLRLWSNGIRGCRAAAISVSGITGGTAGSPSLRCTALPVQLDAPLAPGATASLAMKLAITVPAANDRFGSFGGLALLGTALPTLAVHDVMGWHLDPFIDLGERFYSEVGHYRVTLTVPTELETPATGVLIDTRDNGDGTLSRTYEATNVRDFEWAAGELAEAHGTDARGTLVNVWYRPSYVSAATADRLLGVAVRAMNLFSNGFGAFPYPEVDLVLTDLPYYGMEYPTIVFANPDQYTVAHELAHQWWSGIVGNDQYTSPWLDESFATWSETLPFAPLTCSGPYRWPSYSARVSNSMGYWARHPGQYWIVYDQGACALAALARRFGLNSFLALLRDYVRAHQFGFTTTTEFKAAVELAASSGPAWDSHRFWQRWRIGPRV